METEGRRKMCFWVRRQKKIFKGTEFGSKIHEFWKPRQRTGEAVEMKWKGYGSTVDDLTVNEIRRDWQLISDCSLTEPHAVSSMSTSLHTSSHKLSPPLKSLSDLNLTVISWFGFYSCSKIQLQHIRKNLKSLQNILMISSRHQWN